MPWWLYQIVFAVGYTLMLPRFLLRMSHRGGYRRDFGQRLGFYGADTGRRLRERRRIWVHAVSVGEAYVALSFMRVLRARMPGVSFVLSTTTPTGRAVAAPHLGADDVAIYFPVDFPSSVRRAVSTINPLALVLVESELWPNLIRAASRRGTPMMVVNGRVSQSSYEGYARVGRFFAKVAAMVDCFCVQHEADAERLLRLGAPSARVAAVGSVKYDMADSDGGGGRDMMPLLRAAGAEAGDAIIVGGSTWPGEEAALLACCRRLLENGKHVFLVLVPRHAERAREVIRELERSGLPWALRSRTAPGAAPGEPRPRVLLADSTGELKSLYAAADVVFVGKSLTQHGGQNVIEPAALGKPTIVGPNMENFAGIVEDLTAAGAIAQVADTEALYEALRRFVEDGALREAVGRRGRDMTLSRRGAMDRTVTKFLDLVARKSAAAGRSPAG